jgi:Flp pilus assembly protein TadB
MEVLAMGMHPRERWKLRQIEVVLRKDDPGLDMLLAGRRPRRRPALRAPLVGLMLAFLVPVAALAVGLVLYTAWLIVAGAVLCPFIPVVTWLLMRRHRVDDGASHSRKP